MRLPAREGTVTAYVMESAYGHGECLSMVTALHCGKAEEDTRSSAERCT